MRRNNIVVMTAALLGASLAAQSNTAKYPMTQAEVQHDRGFILGMGRYSRVGAPGYGEIPKWPNRKSYVSHQRDARKRKNRKR